MAGNFWVRLEKRFKGLKRRYWWHAHKSLFPSCGNNIRISPPANLTCNNIFLGSDISIGSGGVFWAVHSKIIIGDKVVFGPQVMVMAGDHDTSQVGRFMIDITDKDKDTSFDQDIVFEEDIWIGARAIILKGVVVGRGAVIGAGAVVIKDVPPYTIAVGSPASPVKMRWPVEKILRHEQLLYPEDKRLSRETLESIARRWM